MSDAKTTARSMASCSGILEIAAPFKHFRALGGQRVDAAAWGFKVDGLVARLGEFAERSFGSSRRVREIVEEFFADFLPKHAAIGFPLQGSTPYGGLLVIYLVARLVEPKTIVESGVFVGASLHALRSAAPDADIWAFDVNLEPLVFKSPSIRYVERDWMDFEEPIDPKSSSNLVFFDDHIDNARRIVEAHARGFRHLIFDDAPKFSELLLYRYPGVPTVPMILERSCPEEMVFQWQYEDKWLEYVHRRDACEEAFNCIDYACVCPDLYPDSGMRVWNKWYVRLR